LSGYRIAANQLRTPPLESVKTESPTVKTFTFLDKYCAKARPGQFLMLWIPGVDEIPLSILGADGKGKVSVAVRDVGEATRALHALGRGEIIGVRGPFGNSFTIAKGKTLLVGGGTGLAPLLFLTRELVAQNVKPVFVMGAKTEDELLFMHEIEEMCGKRNVVATTEDGSCGMTGLCTEPVKKLIESEKPNMIYACGPEKMILKVHELARWNGLEMEASLERLMRCAIGLCGSCMIGRYRVCRDGPVFTDKQLHQVEEEFGKFKLDFDGSKSRI
jgi:dihydroorotate dehydrogenase electron transfer subunit